QFEQSSTQGWMHLVQPYYPTITPLARLCSHGLRMRQGTERGAALQLLENVLGRLAVSHHNQADCLGIWSRGERSGTQGEDAESHRTTPPGQRENATYTVRKNLPKLGHSSLHGPSACGTAPESGQGVRF